MSMRALVAVPNSRRSRLLGGEFGLVAVVMVVLSWPELPAVACTATLGRGEQTGGATGVAVGVTPGGRVGTGVAVAAGVAVRVGVGVAGLGRTTRPPCDPPPPPCDPWNAPGLTSRPPG